MMPKTTPAEVTRVAGGERRQVADSVVTEAPLEIRLAGVPIAVVMRTPGDDAELVRGFALTEAIVLHPREMAEARPLPDPEGNRWELVLADGVSVDPERFRRNLYTTSSCGVCGKASIDAVRIAAPPALPGPVVSPDLLLGLPARMRARQEAFTATGGLHAAALFTPYGDLRELREDVGRHNAVDKVVGAAAATGWPLGESILLVSGRVSFEMVQKAAVAGVPVVCGVSAPSSLAIELAAELGTTVVGFLRDAGFNVYTGAGRVT